MSSKHIYGWEQAIPLMQAHAGFPVYSCISKMLGNSVREGKGVAFGGGTLGYISGAFSAYMCIGAHKQFHLYAPGDGEAEKLALADFEGENDYEKLPWRGCVFLVAGAAESLDAGLDPAGSPSNLTEGPVPEGARETAPSPLEESVRERVLSCAADSLPLYVDVSAAAVRRAAAVDPAHGLFLGEVGRVLPARAVLENGRIYKYHRGSAAQTKSVLGGMGIPLTGAEGDAELAEIYEGLPWKPILAAEVSRPMVLGGRATR